MLCYNLQFLDTVTIVKIKVLFPGAYMAWEKIGYPLYIL